MKSYRIVTLAFGLALPSCGEGNASIGAPSNAAADGAPEAGAGAHDGATTDSGDAGSGADAGATADAAAADAGPVCVYPTYTQADYAGFADAGAYPNLPCGGCAPKPSAGCSTNGSTAGHAYACWSDTGYEHPTYPAAGCITIGISIGRGPNLWDVCCP